MRKRPLDGVTRGNVPPAGATTALVPLPLLPLARRRPVGSHAATIDEVVRRLVVAYRDEAGPRRARALLERMDGAWGGAVRLLAADLKDEGLSSEGFVSFVCAGVRRLRGRAPFAAEVFPQKVWLRDTWLARYRRGGHLDVPGYVAAAERRRLFEERMRACRNQATS